MEGEEVNSSFAVAVNATADSSYSLYTSIPDYHLHCGFAGGVLGLFGRECNINCHDNEDQEIPEYHQYISDWL